MHTFRLLVVSLLFVSCHFVRAAFLTDEPRSSQTSGKATSPSEPRPATPPREESAEVLKGPLKISFSTGGIANNVRIYTVHPDGRVEIFETERDSNMYQHALPTRAGKRVSSSGLAKIAHALSAQRFAEMPNRIGRMSDMGSVSVQYQGKTISFYRQDLGSVKSEIMNASSEAGKRFAKVYEVLDAEVD